MSDLRLAAINGETTIPIGEIGTIADEAYILGSMIESGALNASSALVIAEVDGYVKLICIGPSPTTAEAVGLLELAKARIINGAFQ